MDRIDRRDFFAGLALAGSAAASPAFGKTAPSTARIAQTCQPLTGLSFTAPEQHQMLAAVDDIIDRARGMAKLRLANDLAPAELFDPRLPGWAGRGIADAGDQAAEPDPGPLPPDPDDIAFAPAWRLSRWIASGKLSSRALTDLYLDRIAKRAARLQCIATLLADRARAEADAMDRELAAGRWRGPLHGLPYGLKDLIDTAGIRTAWGAAPYKDRIAPADATIVKRLREAGAVLIAKTSCGAIAYGDIWYGGRTRNPWNVAEGSSGSSAGSAAAVADGLCAFAIGTETMGSIVAPSARCGTAGLRPTFGRVPRTGAMALCWSLDKIGVIARDIGDMAMTLRVLDGPDGEDPCAAEERLNDPPAISARDIRIGYRPEWFADGLPTDRAALDAARKAGFALVEIELPDIDLDLLGGIVITEAAVAFQELTADDRDDLMAWQEDIAWPNSWRAAQFETAVNYIQAQRTRRRLMQAFDTVMAPLDAIIHPHEAGGLMTIGNHCGHPALVVQSGFLDQPTREGFTDHVAPGEVKPGAALRPVPFSVTLTGRLFDEGTLIAIGRMLADHLPRMDRRPPV